ncbi:MAG: DUF2149 domain-containing protein [Gemmatimonadota bacterium]
MNKGPRLRRRPRRVLGTGRFSREHDDDPLTGLANLVDLMLVFACGLLIAVFLSLDLADLLQLPEEERAAVLESLRNAQELDAIDTRPENVTQSEIESAGQYRSVGTVYRDTLTGRMFVIEGDGR